MFKYTYRIDIGGDYTGRVDMSLRFDGGLTVDNAETQRIIGIARELEVALKQLHSVNKAQAERISEME